jgi:hypothetical protein
VLHSTGSFDLVPRLSVYDELLELQPSCLYPRQPETGKKLMVAQACNPSILEPEAGEWGVPGQPRAITGRLCLKKKEEGKVT